MRCGLAPIILARANAGAIGERDPLAVRLQPPARSLILHAPGIMPELGIAFLPRLLLAAVLIEAGNGEPGSICTGLACLRVEASRKGIVFGQR